MFIWNIYERVKIFWQWFQLCSGCMDRYDCFTLGRLKIYGRECHLICFITITSSLLRRENSGGTCSRHDMKYAMRKRMENCKKRQYVEETRYMKWSIWEGKWERWKGIAKSGRADEMTMQEAETRGKLCRE